MAVNTGIHHARGAYIARLDSDDVWLSDMLNLSVNILTTQPEVGLVYGRAQGMDEYGKLLDDFRGSPEWYPGDAFRSMLYTDFTCNITIIARKACFDRVGLFDESMHLNEDWDMWLRVARYYQFAFINRIVARYRYHSNNITGTSSQYFKEHMNGRIKVLDKTFEQPDLPVKYQAMKPVAYSNLNLWIGVCWMKQKEMKCAIGCFRNTLKVKNYSLLAWMQLIWGIMALYFLNRFYWGRHITSKISNLVRPYLTK